MAGEKEGRTWDLYGGQQNRGSLARGVQGSLGRRQAMATVTSKPTALLALPPTVVAGLLPFFRQGFNVLRLDQALDPSSFIALHSSSIVALVTFRATSQLILSLPNLRLIACPGVGFENIDLDCCRERRISVSNGHAVSTDDVADLAILLMLAVSRRLPAADRHVRQGSWPQKGEFMLTRKASGKRVGIVGLGHVGLAIARRAEAFGCSISYQGRSQKPNVPYLYYSDVVDLATNSDILIVSCALTNETKHLIGRKVLNALGQDGTLINIARGHIVDEVELIAALKEGGIGAAGLDVFENEPNVPMELCGMDNVVLTPHIGNATTESRTAMAALVVANMDAFFSGKPLLTPVIQYD